MTKSPSAPAKSPFIVIIVDDHFVVRSGLMAALEVESDIVVAGAAGTAAEALALCVQHRPDVILLDLQLPDMDGRDLVGRLRAVSPAARILVFSATARDDELEAVMNAGACGYVQKHASREELLLALRRIAAGGQYLSADLRQRIRELRVEPAITPREREVLALIARGQSNKEIAATLAIAADTVKEHISVVLEKLGVKDRAQAATEAIRRGLIKLAE